MQSPNSNRKQPHRPANGGWRVGCDDEQSAHLQHRRPDHSHSYTGRPDVFDYKEKKIKHHILIFTKIWQVSDSYKHYQKVTGPSNKLAPDKTNCVHAMWVNSDYSYVSPSWLCVSISDSGLSIEAALEGDENEGVDSHSSLSDSVISPSSGSLFPSDPSLRVAFFFFLCFSDLDFFLFFLESPLSSWCEPFFCFFLFDGYLSPSSLRLDESFLRGATSGLRDLRFAFRDSVFFLVVCLSTQSASSSSSFTSSLFTSCH